MIRRTGESADRRDDPQKLLGHLAKASGTGPPADGRYGFTRRHYGGIEGPRLIVTNARVLIQARSRRRWVWSSCWVRASATRGLIAYPPHVVSENNPHDQHYPSFVTVETVQAPERSITRFLEWEGPSARAIIHDCTIPADPMIDLAQNL
jgi:hypothetical protein